MLDYDFHTLSPIDFENLVRDLLQEELKVRLESFKPGQDKGIDLRYKDDPTKFMIQCKHYYKSGIKSLLQNLKSFEKQKVEALKPDRYILATSVPLSPDNKNSISEKLQKNEDQRLLHFLLLFSR